MENQIEIWVDIVNYEGIYKISNLGKIKSLSRNLTSKNNSYRKTKEKIITGTINKFGYLYIELSNKGVSKKYYIHKLIAIHFIKNEYNKPFVNHKNGIKLDNSINNLEWCTASENILHSYRVLNRVHSQPAKGKFGWLNKGSIAVIQYDLNDNIVNIFGSISEANRKTGINNIWLAINNKLKKAGGYKWKKY